MCVCACVQKGELSAQTKVACLWSLVELNPHDWLDFKVNCARASARSNERVSGRASASKNSRSKSKSLLKHRIVCVCVCASKLFSPKLFHKTHTSEFNSKRMRAWKQNEAKRSVSEYECKQRASK